MNAAAEYQTTQNNPYSVHDLKDGVDGRSRKNTASSQYEEEAAQKSYNPPNEISIAVDPVALITTECITVTSAMRKHARWAQSSVSAILGGGGALDSGRTNRLHEHMKRGALHTKPLSRPGNNFLAEEDGISSRWGLRGKKGKSMQDNPLMSAFARLRSDLRGCTSRSNLAPGRYMILTKNRYQDLRYAITSPSIPPGHPVIIYVGTYHLPRHYSYHQVFRI